MFLNYEVVKVVTSSNYVYIYIYTYIFIKFQHMHICHYTYLLHWSI